jgi:hypothetical protein
VSGAVAGAGIAERRAAAVDPSRRWPDGRPVIAVAAGVQFQTPFGNLRLVRWEGDKEKQDLFAVVEHPNGDRESIAHDEWMETCQLSIPVAGSGPYADFQSSNRYPHLDDLERAKIRAWVHELLEIIHGDPGGTIHSARPSHTPRPEYDPLHTEESDRVRAKIVELQEKPSPVIGSPSRPTVYRKLRELRDGGVEALIPKDRLGALDKLAAVDQSIKDVAEATATALRAQSKNSWSKKNRLLLFRANLLVAGIDLSGVPDSHIEEVEAAAAARAGIIVPASTRLDQASRPNPRRHGSYIVTRPGELGQIDIWKLDAFVWSPLHPALTADVISLLDVWDRRVLACLVVPHPATARDVSITLFRSVNPVVPQYELEHGPRWWPGPLQNVIIPEGLPATDMQGRILRGRRMDTIVMDHGAEFDSTYVSSVAVNIGMSVVFAAPAHGHQKNVVESWHNVLAGWTQTFPGAKGARVQHRGRRVEETALWAIEDVQIALNRRIRHQYHWAAHEGLPSQSRPGVYLSPNAAYAEYLNDGGAPNVLARPTSIFPFLPSERVRAQSNGVHINSAIYDGPGLRGYYNSDRGPTGPELLVAYDPYDPSRLYLEDPRTLQFSTLRETRANAGVLLPLAGSRKGARDNDLSQLIHSSRDTRDVAATILAVEQLDLERAIAQKNRGVAVAYERLLLAANVRNDSGLARIAPDPEEPDVIEPGHLQDEPDPAGLEDDVDAENVDLAGADTSWWTS